MELVSKNSVTALSCTKTEKYKTQKKKHEHISQQELSVSLQLH